jgi:hypothetical protein
VDIEMPEDEMKLSKVEVAHGLLVESVPPGIGQLMKCYDFSSLYKLLSVLQRDSVTTISDDLARAETLWVAESQKMLTSDRNSISGRHIISQCGGSRGKK